MQDGQWIGLGVMILSGFVGEAFSQTVAQPAENVADAPAEALWQDYDLSRFVSLQTDAPNPGQFLLNWILDETGTGVWHGAFPAVLSLSEQNLRVYHSAAVQRQVAEIVRRFTHPVHRAVNLRLRVLVCDVGWRRRLLPTLKPLYVGPQGQQVWELPTEDSSLMMSELSADRSRVTVTDERLEIVNGTPEVVDLQKKQNYIASVKGVDGVASDLRPSLASVMVGLRIELVPLWNRNGDSLDLHLAVQTNRIMNLFQSETRIPTPGGYQSLTVQVPEVAGTEMDHTIPWEVSHTLVVSLGSHPGLLRGPRGWGGIFGSRPEVLLVLATAQPIPARRTARKSGSQRWRPLGRSQAR